MGRPQLAWLARLSLLSGGVTSSYSLRPFPLHSPCASSPFPQLGGGEWAGGRRSRLRSLMISCPHHSFLSHAGGEKERQAGSKRRAGTAGHRDPAAGSWGTGPSSDPGSSIFQSQYCSQLSPVTECGHCATKENAAASCQISGWGPLSSTPLLPLCLEGLQCSRARGRRSADGSRHSEPCGAGPLAAAIPGHAPGCPVCTLP